MKLSELKSKLSTLNAVNFVLPNGTFIPRHFHVTEIGLVTKNFIDCGGTIRKAENATMQIWVAEDFDHRLKPSGLLNILNISNTILGNTDWDIEVEYQTETTGTYHLGFEGENFVLLPKQTDCLAKSTCGIPETKLEVVGAGKEEGCCKPGGGCC
ncbi:MAG TPA: DUF6428 family protein [Chitinophagales bacterium]|nr:DUF6428 family protein [Chitinophagales bacterium]